MIWLYYMYMLQGMCVIRADFFLHHGVGGTGINVQMMLVHRLVHICIQFR